MDSEEIPIDEFQDASGPVGPSPQDSSDGSIPVDEFEKNEYGSTNPEDQSSSLEQIGAGIEGTAQGFAGPVATLAEQGLGSIGIPGFSDKEIATRREKNPLPFGAGEALGTGLGLYTGAGEAGLLAKAFGQAEGATRLARIGSGAIKMALQSGLIQGGNEISKGLLGQSDPEAPVSSALSHMGAAMLFGLVTGGAFSSLGEGASAANEAAIAKKANDWAAGFGVKSMPNASEGEMLAPMGVDPKMYQRGQEFFDKVTSGQFGKGALGTGIKAVSRTAAPILGALVGGNPTIGGLASSGVEFGLEKAVEKGIPFAARKYIGPALYRMASQDAVEGNIGNVINYCSNIAKGETTVSKGIQSLFGGPSIVDAYDYANKREKLRDHIENGGTDAQITDAAQQQPQPEPQFAEGGEVQPMQELNQPDAIAKYFPEHNLMLSAAKTRVSNYLNSVRPVTSPTMKPYDKEHKDPTSDRQYDKTLDLANNPLSILKNIKNGSLVPRQLQDFKSMYPELHSHLSKKITERIMQGKLKEEKPPRYKTRQAMSLFMGTELDSTLTQPNIMAAQQVFMQQNQQRQAQKSNSLNKLAQSSQTPEQSREQRLNKS